MNTPEPREWNWSRTDGSHRQGRRLGSSSQTIGTKLYPGRIDEAANGLTSNEESASTALSARSSGLDDGNGGPECGVYTQMSGVEQVRVRGRLQGGGGAPGIALVATQEVVQYLLLVRLFAPRPQLQHAPLGAHLGAGNDEQLHVGAGGDHGADIAAIEHGAGGFHGKLALIAHQCLAHFRDRRDHRRRLGDGLQFQGIVVEFLRIERHRRFDGARGVVERIAGIEHRFADGAVEQPGIEMMEPINLCEVSRDRALAGSRRSVDGDDHDKSAPSPRISSTKPGKLVAMNVPSSICTGLSLASPKTIAAIAMR